MQRLLTFLALAFLAVSAHAAVKGEPVDYKAGDTVLKGYIAYDDAIKGKRPGVIVVHEWWGHNEYARKRADMLAALGYTAIALDMYGDGKQAAHPDDAGKFAGEVSKNLPLAKARFDAARNLLAKHSTVDAREIAAIGYCFGGGIVLQMARQGEDLKGVASFHGSLGTENPATAGKVKARVLVMTGADDPFIPAEKVEAFKKEMSSAKANYRVIAYPGAKHAFTNPDADKNGKQFNLPLAYNADADTKSWAEMQKFLKEIFAKK
ncbi:MAG: dienelactone hydrolase family protein [Gammaproteobacteria bacterium]|nr:dienelactone hydrolase family protein [Gammaproteobacteria bacterium]